MRTKPPPKKTRPVFRKVIAVAPSNDSGPMIAGMCRAGSAVGAGPDGALGRARRTFGNRSPTVPAARITHTALVFNAPAARAAPAIHRSEEHTSELQSLRHLV